MGRKRLHDETTVVALLDAAEAIVEADGLEGLSVRRVAQQVGTTTRAVYSTLGSMDALVAALGSRAFDLLGARIAALPRTDDPAADLITAATAGFRRWALDHPALFRVGFQHQMAVPREVWARFAGSAERALDMLRDLLQRVHDDGGLAGRTVDRATWQFHSLCEGLAAMDLRRGLPGAGTDTLPIWTDAVSALIAGWRTTEP